MAPAVKRIVKKKTNKFRRHQSDNFMRVPESWRKPKGIDSRIRRRFRGTTLMPNIGYGSDKRTKFQLANGKYAFQIRSPADIELLMMHNEKYAAVLASNLSGRTRKAVIERADQIGVQVLNRNAKMAAEETN
ncbi:60S ribosomal protein L32 [Perkinsus chesapeaki]|uniref:60S ribosomal protein L32 n=1 Tax=Perkinsus chesapeaki TaxID=330153 RepID=A0A7J6N160_PERCH|nr:60S ribosomal protein L32 [Perkinsus chesapeaki]